MRSTKQINIKNQTYYLFNDMINIKNFDPNLIKIDKKSYQNIGIYQIGYITIKNINDCENINSVNPLHLMISEIGGYIKTESNGNKYLTFASIDKNKKVLEKYTKLRMKLNHVQTINAGKSDECNSIECNSVQYDKDYMKIKFNSDDDLPINKIVRLHILTITVYF